MLLDSVFVEPVGSKPEIRPRFGLGLSISNANACDIMRPWCEKRIWFGKKQNASICVSWCKGPPLLEMKQGASFRERIRAHFRYAFTWLGL